MCELLIYVYKYEMYIIKIEFCWVGSIKLIIVRVYVYLIILVFGLII